MKPAIVLTVLSLSLLGGLQKQDSREVTFWRWFQANESRLFEFEKDQERVFDDLQMELQRVQPGLTFEFGPKQNGKREFVISADGIRETFPAVVALADAAPRLQRWTITKFRPRRGFQSAITLNGLKLSPEQVEFTLEPDGEKIGITLFVAGYNASEQKKYFGVVFLMLDQALGEYDVETKVGFIELKPSDAESRLAKHRFSTLAKNFDQMIKFARPPKQMM